MFVRLGRGLLATVAGAATGTAAVALHGEVWGWVLSAAAALAAAFALPPAWWGRLVFCWAFAGVVFALSGARPEGDYLVAGDTAGYGLLTLAVGIAVVGAAGVLVRARGRTRADAGSGPTRP